tara:strand:- start:38 stop:460 length:423 start_codon:yes stop_codon:yes gene_type:complete
MNKQTKKFSTHLFRQIAKNYDISKDELQSVRRYQEIVKYRQFFSAYMRTQHKMSLVEIGKQLKRDHSTIVNLLKKFEDHYQFDLNYANQYADFVYVMKKNTKDEMHTRALKILELIEGKSTIGDRVMVIKKLISDGSQMV